MNAPIPGFHTAELFFSRREPQSLWPSEISRQEWIDRKAEQIAADIRERITTDVSLALEIGALALSDLSEDEEDAAAIAILRYMPGHEHRACLLIDKALEAAILRTAGKQAAELAQNGPDQD